MDYRNLLNPLLNLARQHPVLGVVGLLTLYILYKWKLQKTSSKKVTDFPAKYPPSAGKEGQQEFYDVAIVGAGPAGATCAYFLGKAGGKVALIEKKSFPRDKHCGDAVCKTGIEILHEMGIYKKLIDENKARVADNGGLVSPSGLSYVGHSKEGMGEIPAALACKRIHLDNAIAMAAKEAGADLKENCPVSDAKFDKEKGLWTVYIDDENKTTFTARVLVCADGSQSRLAMQLGLIKDPPVSSCSRAYVEGGSHCFKADGVVFYPRGLLPGYAALFRHPGDELNYCVYIIPGNPAVQEEHLAHWHDHLRHHDPFISKALGPGAKMERMKAASLRLGGTPVSHADHLLIVGDAAGMIDPLTGEGIHTAMDGGKMAAHFLTETLHHGNFDREVMAIYHARWMNKFGSDFKWSMMFCQMLYRYPILLDAAAAAVARKGDAFLVKWADIMTGRCPKRDMLKPEFSVTITFELLRLLVKRAIGAKVAQAKGKELNGEAAK